MSTQPAQPTDAGERIVSMDALRGFAILGILLMNIPIYGGRNLVYPTTIAPRNIAVWIAATLLVSAKMRSILSMLFGAGIILLDGRAEQRGQSFAAFFYRRMGFMLLIGVLHLLFF